LEKINRHFFRVHGEAGSNGTTLLFQRVWLSGVSGCLYGTFLLSLKVCGMRVFPAAEGGELCAGREKMMLMEISGACQFRRARRPGGIGHVLGHTRYLPRPLSRKKWIVSSRNAPVKFGAFGQRRFWSEEFSRREE
jgi:hypothetical protein